MATMKKGEVSKLTIQADYGYGASGSPPTIPGGATLVGEGGNFAGGSVLETAVSFGCGMAAVFMMPALWCSPRMRLG